jgi:hypothetical protein
LAESSRWAVKLLRGRFRPKADVRVSLCIFATRETVVLS